MGTPPGALVFMESESDKLMLQASNLTKSYPDRPLFERASFVINQGERLGLVGPNGSGKTTLLRLLTGTEMPDEGSRAGDG